MTADAACMLPAGLQIKDLNSGTFGFVQLARDKQTGEVWALKFIERGEKVGAWRCCLPGWQARRGALGGAPSIQQLGIGRCRCLDVARLLRGCPQPCWQQEGPHEVPIRPATLSRRLPSTWSARLSTRGSWSTHTSCSSAR